MEKVIFKDLGLIPYKEAWDLQKKEFNLLIESKKNNKQNEQFLLFCEHPHVYTLGKHGEKENLLITEAQLKQYQAEFYEIDRGGDITYHGQGQLVGYPILDLDELGIGVKEYIFRLEEAVIEVMREYGLVAARLENAPGIWLGQNDRSHLRKICAIGVKASHKVTMHGFALNVNTDLRYFSYINPCGFVDKSATSMQAELKQEINMQEIKIKLKNKLYELLVK